MRRRRCDLANSYQQGDDTMIVNTNNNRTNSKRTKKIRCNTSIVGIIGMLTIGSFVFGSVVFYAEEGSNHSFFPSFPWLSTSYYADGAILYDDTTVVASLGRSESRNNPRTKNNYPDTKDIIQQPDAIVIGSGLAGLTAALHILDRGGKVIIMEKESTLGGNSNKASSGINACCDDNSQTKQQEEDDYDFDTLEEFQEDTIRSAGDAAQLDLINVLTSNSEKAVTWLQNRVHVDLSVKAQLGGHSHKRTHRPRIGMVGATIIYGMEQAIRLYEKKEQVIIMENTKVIKIIREEQGEKKVIGVQYETINDTKDNDSNSVSKKKHQYIREAQQRNDNKNTIYANSIILATGGFASDRTRNNQNSSNNSYLYRYRPELINFPTTGGRFSTGDGITLATSIHADLIDMDKIQIHPTGFIDPKDPDNPTKTLAAELLRGVGGIVVNTEGKRFCNELGTRAYVTDKMLSHNSNYLKTKKWDTTTKVPYFYLILSNSAAQAGDKHVQLYTNKGLMVRIQGIEELAKHIQVSKDTIQSTIQKYIESSLLMLDEFDKTSFRGMFSSDLDNEIFYVGIVSPVLHYCMGGITINTNGNVIDIEGNIIPGLYAAGEVTGGVHGNNRLGGNSLLECTVYGMIIGQEIPIRNKPSSSKVLENEKSEAEAAAAAAAEEEEEYQKTIITLDELSQHNKPNDCWVAIHGIVYDLTTFAEKHPAGSQAIHNLAGTDGTETFSTVHGISMLSGVLDKRMGVLSTPKDSATHADTNDNASLENRNSNSMKRKIIPLKELNQHNKPTSCWVAIDGIVYDLTNFAEKHPAGANIIHNLAGMDGTATFSNVHNMAMLSGFSDQIMGVLEGTDRAANAIENNIDDVGGLTNNKLISHEELKMHNNKSDLWVAIDGSVYDLTKFDHRGGAHLIAKLAGKDSTEKFFAVHGDATLLRVAHMKIGTLIDNNDL